MEGFVLNFIFSTKARLLGHALKESKIPREDM
jgi:hypothetical protein